MLDEMLKYAPIFTAFVAFVGACIAITQLARNQRNQRETTAKNVFREYLKLAFDHPDFATPDYRKLAKSPEQLEKYAWFVAYLLWACEEMLQFARRDEIWQNNLQLNVNYHREYFINDKEFNAKDLQVYDPEVQTLVLNAKGSNPTALASPMMADPRQ